MGLDNSNYGITYFVFPDCEAEEIKHTVGFHLKEKQRRTNASSWVAVATLLSKPCKVHAVGMISNDTDRNY